MIQRHVVTFELDAAAADVAASVVLDSVNANADLTYTAQVAGTGGNSITIEQTEGATGVGNENRALGVAVVADAITVTFATDGGGNSIHPTANAVKALVDGDGPASAKVAVAVQGTGVGTVDVFGVTSLTGGSEGGLESGSMTFNTSVTGRVLGVLSRKTGGDATAWSISVSEKPGSVDAFHLVHSQTGLAATSRDIKDPPVPFFNEDHGQQLEVNASIDSPGPSTTLDLEVVVLTEPAAHK